MLRDPPPQWYLAGYFQYEPPEWVMERKGSGLPTSRWSKALDNTFAMMEKLGIKAKPIEADVDSN